MPRTPAFLPLPFPSPPPFSMMDSFLPFQATNKVVARKATENVSSQYSNARAALRTIETIVRRTSLVGGEHRPGRAESCGWAELDFDQWATPPLPRASPQKLIWQKWIDFEKSNPMVRLLGRVFPTGPLAQLSAPAPLMRLRSYRGCVCQLWAEPGRPCRSGAARGLCLQSVSPLFQPRHKVL
jgi:hypothetical protein